MNTSELVATLAEQRVLVIVRLDAATLLTEVTTAIAASGATVMEVSLTTPGALTWLRDVRVEGIAVGAGTVRDRGQAEAAIEAGAEFLVSPHFDPAILQVAANAGVAALPGVWTATEATAATRAGAGAVKLFPASTGGPEHLRALRGPLPDIGFVPVGGVHTANAVDYLEAGALAVGVGSSFVDQTVVERAGWAELTQGLTALVQRCRQHLDGSP